YGGWYHARRLVVHPGEPANPLLLPPPLALDLPDLVQVPLPHLAVGPRADAHPPRPRRGPGIPGLAPGWLRPRPDGHLGGALGQLRLRDRSPGLVTEHAEIPHHGLRGPGHRHSACAPDRVHGPAGTMPVPGAFGFRFVDWRPRPRVQREMAQVSGLEPPG